MNMKSGERQLKKTELKKRKQGTSAALRVIVLAVVLTAAGGIRSLADDAFTDSITDAWNLIDPNVLTCDIGANPACRNYGVRTVFQDLLSDYKGKAGLYHKQNLCLTGTVRSVASDGSKIELSDPEDPSRTVTGNVKDAAVREQVKKLKPGDAARLMGKVTAAKTLTGVSIRIENVIRAEKTALAESPGPGVFSFTNGKSYDTASGVPRSLAGGQLLLTLPASWADVEEPVSGIGMQGWLYRLNEIPADFREKPEQVYVFFFDNETGLRDSTDADRNEADIERAVIRNIFDKDLDYRRHIRRDTELQYDYFRGSYRDGTNRYHNVEFICTALDKKGIFCVMYVYDSSDHKEDIICLLQTLVKKKQ